MDDAEPTETLTEEIKEEIQDSIMAGKTDAEIISEGTTTAQLTAAKADLLQVSVPNNTRPIGTITRAQPD